MTIKIKINTLSIGGKSEKKPLTKVELLFANKLVAV